MLSDRISARCSSFEVPEGRAKDETPELEDDILRITKGGRKRRIRNDLELMTSLYITGPGAETRGLRPELGEADDSGFRAREAWRKHKA